MSAYSGTLSRFRDNQSLLFLLNVLRGEATYTNLIVFGLTRSRLVPTIYHTRGEHANHDITDVIEFIIITCKHC